MAGEHELIVVHVINKHNIVVFESAVTTYYKPYTSFTLLYWTAAVLLIIYIARAAVSKVYNTCYIYMYVCMNTYAGRFDIILRERFLFIFFVVENTMTNKRT